MNVVAWLFAAATPLLAWAVVVNWPGRLTQSVVWGSVGVAAGVGVGRSIIDGSLATGLLAVGAAVVVAALLWWLPGVPNSVILANTVLIAVLPWPYGLTAVAGGWAMAAGVAGYRVLRHADAVEVQRVIYDTATHARTPAVFVTELAHGSSPVPGIEQVVPVSARKVVVLPWFSLAVAVTALWLWF